MASQNQGLSHEAIAALQTEVEENERLLREVGVLGNLEGTMCVGVLVTKAVHMDSLREYSLERRMGNERGGVWGGMSGSRCLGRGIAKGVYQGVVAEGACPGVIVKGHVRESLLRGRGPQACSTQRCVLRSFFC